MTAAVLSIGAELVRGEIIDRNASWLAEQLTSLGLQVAQIESVADDPARIARALKRLGEEHRVLVCTGGLGPTTDDLTAESVAQVLGVPLRRDEASLAAIGERLERFGRKLAPSNAKQADLPQGAAVLPNREGTAPGFAVRIGRAQAFFLPGVPREMRAMFEQQVLPCLEAPQGERSHQVRIRTFGLPESEVNDRLQGLEQECGVRLAYRAHFPEIEVKVRASPAGGQPAESRARVAADQVVARLGADVAYGEGDRGLPEVVGELLVQRGLRLALAESCTGGLVGELLTDNSGASAYFLGGAVTYSNAAKEQLLGVEAALLEQHGAVSPEVARAMAEGARRRFGADLALSLTGVAGPTGGSPEKPVGLVHYAVATAEGTVDERLLYPSSRDRIRRRATFAGLALVRQVLLHGIEAVTT